MKECAHMHFASWPKTFCFLTNGNCFLRLRKNSLPVLVVNWHDSELFLYFASLYMKRFCDHPSFSRVLFTPNHTFWTVCLRSASGKCSRATLYGGYHMTLMRLICCQKNCAKKVMIRYFTQPKFGHLTIMMMNSHIRSYTECKYGRPLGRCPGQVEWKRG